VDPKHKTFVWMAAIELVEQARLIFTTDVKRYLRGVRIPTTLPGPIALEHLVMHIAGSD
jgi:CubicO group peptidase (beta-lactamase class C family)